jgi:hypothetical protein
LAFPEDYLIKVQEEQRGPYTYPQLKQLYDKNLIPEDTLYWKDGMEEWQAVSDLCGAERRSRLRRLKQLRITGVVLIALAGLGLGYCGTVLKDGWREMNERSWDANGAYWRARGFVREDVKKQDGSAGFEPIESATVTVTGTEATVILPGVLYGKDGSTTKTTWKVAINYDAARRDWVLPAK